MFTADPGPCCNTIEITNSEYVVLRYLTVDGKGVDGAFGLSAKGGDNNLVHHITVEGCTFIGHDNGQQTVAVSYTHLRAHETVLDLVCRLLPEKKTHIQSPDTP